MGRKDKIFPKENEQLFLGAKMRLARQSRNISLTTMAGLLKYSKSHISGVENGVVPPSPELVEKYESQLQLKAGELMQYYNQAEKEQKKNLRSDRGEMPLISNFYGRKQELEDLQARILDDRYQMIVVLGLGGIGKTTLVASLVAQIENEFEYFFWRSLQDAPSLDVILSRCIHHLSDCEGGDIPTDRDRQIQLFIELLQKKRCLIVLDNLESVLGTGNQSGHYRKGYEEYGKLLRRVGEIRHQSCLLLTSREKPREITLQEDSTDGILSYLLTGLPVNEGLRILENKELHGIETRGEELIQRYNGNPLALKLVSQLICEVYAGDIAQFLEDGNFLFSDIREVLDQQFERLSPLEQEILYWLAIEREASSLHTIKKNSIQAVTISGLSEAIRSLRRRHLIDTDTTGEARFSLQHVVKDYVTEHFIDQVYEEIISNAIFVFEHYPLIKALAKDYVRETQVHLILRPLLEKLLMFLGKEATEQKLKHILDVLRASPQNHGYAAGNILNILVELHANLSGYDFSQLTIRQAYLQGVSLPGVNFAGCDFVESVFTDTFGRILSVAFSPDGELLAAGTVKGEVRLWDVTSATPLSVYSEHTDWVWSVTFSPDGTMLASGSSDRSIRLWDVTAGRCIRVLNGHTNRVRSVAFSSDALLLASGSEDQTVRLWDVNTGQCRLVLRGHTKPIRSIAFNRDSHLLASASDDTTIRIWDIHTGLCTRVLQEHTEPVWSVAFHPTRDILASGGDDKILLLWDINTGEMTEILLGHHNWISSVAFSSDGHLLASGSADRTTRLWNISTRETIKKLQGHRNWISSVTFSPNGRLLASGSHDQTVRIWDVSTGESIKTLQGYANLAWSLAFSPDGRLLASGSDDQTIRLWDVKTGQSLKSLHGHETWIRSLVFSPDGRLLASGSDDKTVRLWDIETGQSFQVLQGHENRVWSIAFSPNGRLLASGSHDQTIRIWDVETGQSLKVLDKHTNRIRTVLFSPDGYLLASGSDDKTVRLWDIEAGQPFQVLQGHENRVWSIAFSPDGRLLASGSEDQTVQIWDVQTGTRRHLLSGHTKAVWSIAFSPDGRLLASGSHDQTIRIWSVQTGQLLQELQGHADLVWSIIFDPSGEILASSSSDETIKLWDSQNGMCLNVLSSDKPYDQMNIKGVKGVTPLQKATLKALGAVG